MLHLAKQSRTLARSFFRDLAILGALACAPLFFSCGGSNGGGGGSVNPASNANLGGLSFSAGTLTPAFSPSRTTYTITSGSAVASTTVTASTAAGTASVTVDGMAATSGVAFGPIDLTQGANPIVIVVTAEDTTAKTYTVTVTRQAVSANLISLMVGAGPLIPAFSPAVTSYTVSAPQGIASMTLIAKPADLSSTMTVDGVPAAADQAIGPIPLNPGDNMIPVVVTAVDTSTVTYTVNVEVPVSTTATQRAYVKATNTELFDAFGTTVAISGNTMAVGAPGEDSNSPGVNGSQSNNIADDSGAAYVYTRSGLSWFPEAYVKASNPGVADGFGSAIALDGDTLVVGAPSEASAATGIDGDQTNNNAPLSGAVYVFKRSGTTWTQQAYIKASNTGSTYQFGFSVALDGDTLVVGSPEEPGASIGVNGNQGDTSQPHSGAAYVFKRNGTTWTQEAYVKASNTQALDRFGWRVAVDGDTLAVSAIGEASNATGIDGNQLIDSASGSGAVYTFTRSGTTWTQQSYIKSSNSQIGDAFGASLSLSGNTLAVGATLEDSGATTVDGNQGDNSQSGAGAVYVFVKSGITWVQEAYVKASNAEGSPGGSVPGDNFGTALALAGDMLVVSSPNEDSDSTGVNGAEGNSSAQSSGAVYVFLRSGGFWTQTSYVKASNTAANDAFGTSVAIGGMSFVVGAPNEDSSALSVGGNETNDGAPQSGAVYVFQ